MESPEFPFDTLWELPDWSLPVRRRSAIVHPEGSTLATHLAAVETKVLASFPRIIEHLVVTKLDDGASRTPGTLMLKTLGSTFIVVVKEPDDALQMSLVGPTLDDALTLAELMLGGEQAPWEPDTWQRARNTKSKK
jgi:hypothetical protein